MSPTTHTKPVQTRSLARTPSKVSDAIPDRVQPEKSTPKPARVRLRTLKTPNIDDAEDPPALAETPTPEKLKDAPVVDTPDAPIPDPLPVAGEEGVLEGDGHVHDEDDEVDGQDIPPGTTHAAYYPLPEKFTPVGPGEIEIRSVNTREKVRVKLFDAKGRLRSRAVKKLRRVLRDHRKNRSRTMSNRLLIVLYLIGQEYGRPIELISGYRVKGSKKRSRRRKRTRNRRKKGRRRTKRRRKKRGVKRSKHGTGEASDIRLPGVPSADLAWFVRSRFENVGVGYYPTSKFVHVDVRGASFYWRDPSGPGQAQRLYKVPIKPTPPKGSDWTLRSKRLPAALRDPKK